MKTLIKNIKHKKANRYIKTNYINLNNKKKYYTTIYNRALNISKK